MSAGLARLAALTALALALGADAGAARAAPRAPRVPLGESFPLPEQIALTVVAAADLGLLTLQHVLLQDRAPLVTDVPRWDRRVSEALYRGPGAGRWLGGVPDVTGSFVAPALAGVVYFTDAYWLWSRGEGILGDRNADHELLALFEALSVNLMVNQAAKVSVGRLRPEYALGRRAGDPRADAESTASFYSMHASASFCLAGFVSRDLGDWLAGERLAGASRAARLWLGRVLPSLALHGAASVIAVSRVVDQKHFLSDVALGALAGSAIGNLAYAAHFDGAGRARRRPWGSGLVLSPLGVAWRGAF